MNFYTKSSIINLIFNGRILDILSPWELTIDFSNNLIVSEKRNWYLIGVDKNIIPISNIRNVSINEHLFGSDIFIKIYGSTISSFYLPKKDVLEIKKILLDKNK